MQSIRFSHPYVRWAFIFSGGCASEKEPEFCRRHVVSRDHPSSCATFCISQLRDKWPSVQVLGFLEVSSAQSQCTSSVDVDSRMDRICFDASSFCPVERLRTFHVSSPVRRSWKCRNRLSRDRLFLHLPVGDRTVPSFCDWSAKELESSLQFLSHHTATAMVTSARKQTPQRLEQTRCSLLSSSFCCAVIAWLVTH